MLQSYHHSTLNSKILPLHFFDHPYKGNCLESLKIKNKNKIHITTQ